MAAMKFRGRYIISIIDLSAGEAAKASSGLLFQLFSLQLMLWSVVEVCVIDIVITDDDVSVLV